MGSATSREKQRSPKHPVLSHPSLAATVADFLPTHDLLALRRASRPVAAVLEVYLRDGLLRTVVNAFLPVPVAVPAVVASGSTANLCAKLGRVLSPTAKASFYGDLCSLVDPGTPLACSRLLLSAHWAQGLSVVGDSTVDGVGLLLGREADTKRAREAELRVLSASKFIHNDLLHGNAFIMVVDLSALCGVQLIGDNCLAGCTSLQSVNLSGLRRVQRIGCNFLRSASQLQTLDFSALVSLEEVGHHFLAYCYRLTRLDLRPLRKLSRVGDDALDGCANALHYLRQQGNWVEVPTGSRSRRFCRHWDPLASDAAAAETASPKS